MKKSSLGKMPRTRELVQCFSDTENYYNRNLAADTLNAVNNTQVYPEQFRDEELFLEGRASALIQIAEKTALEIAQQFALQEPAILYFGDALVPGGNVQNGTENVEACICRCTNLYACLSQERVSRYYYHYHQNKGYPSERIVVAEGVRVFKDNGAFPSLLDDIEQYSVDILACSAVKEDDPVSMQTQLFERISNSLSVAASLGIQILIVAPVDFDTDPSQAKIIANTFLRALAPYLVAFRRVVFAVKANIEHQCEIIGDIFRDVFQQEHMSASIADGETTNLQSELSRQKKQNISPYDIHPLPVCFKHPDFTMWRKENGYFGKSFVVFGDACSMLSPYSPSQIAPFYQETNAELAGIQSWTDIWWGQVIDFFGGKLAEIRGAADCCINEIPQKLLIQENSEARNAHVVIVCQGVQDWIHGIPVESHKESCDFRSEYRNLLHTLKRQYPNAELWCCTLPRTCIPAQPLFKFPYVCGGIHISEYNLAIQEEAQRMGNQVIDLYQSPTPFETVDGLHYNADGMKQVAMMVCRAIAPAEGASVWNCKENEHEYTELPGLQNEHRFVCKKCGVNQSKAKEVLHDLLSCSISAKKTPQNQAFDQHLMKGGWKIVSHTNMVPEKTSQTPFVALSTPEEIIQPETSVLTKSAAPNSVPKTSNLNTGYYLYVIHNGRQYPLDPQRTVRIGRNIDQCNIAFQNTVISRVHAILNFKDGAWTVQDNHSRNGTQLNDTTLQPDVSYAMRAGDVIQLSNAIQIQLMLTKSDSDEPEDETLILEINNHRAQRASQDKMERRGNHAH